MILHWKEDHNNFTGEKRRSWAITGQLGTGEQFLVKIKLAPIRSTASGQVMRTSCTFCSWRGSSGACPPTSNTGQAMSQAYHFDSNSVALSDLEACIAPWVVWLKGLCLLMNGHLSNEPDRSSETNLLLPIIMATRPTESKDQRWLNDKDVMQIPMQTWFVEELLIAGLALGQIC